MGLESGVQVGDFEIVKRLGAGGMGIVYLARQISLDRLVALKVLGPALNRSSDKARFRREAASIAKLNHPGIALVHFIGQDRDVCYIAMEYIDGGSVREAIIQLRDAEDPASTIDSVFKIKSTKLIEDCEERFDDVPTADLPTERELAGDSSHEMKDSTRRLIASSGFIRRNCEMIRDIANALAHAHSRGVIHRDLKPENLLIDQGGMPHLIDFGLARFFDDPTLTNTGALIGTPIYMSPEQVTGRIQLDARTDLYSLGLILYELLTPRLPVIAQTREGVFRQILSKALHPVSSINPGVPRQLEAIVHKATSKDPDERYQSASEFADDLDNFLGGRPVNAPPYRYKFDRKEIAAERPREAVVCSYIFFLISIATVTLSGLVTTYEWESTAIASRTTLALAIVSFLLGLFGFWLSSGLYDGKEIARRWVFILCFVNPIALVVGINTINYARNIGSHPAVFDHEWGLIASKAVAAYAFLELPFFCLAWLLSKRNVREWFRFAESIRLEYGHKFLSKPIPGPMQS